MLFQVTLTASTSTFFWSLTYKEVSHNSDVEQNLYTWLKVKH